MSRFKDMPYGGEFARQRDNVIAAVSEHLDDEKEALQEVSEWLDDEFSEAEVRKILERKRRHARAKANGVPLIFSGPDKNIEPYNEPAMPGDSLRADRLEQAINSLLKSNREGDPNRILGEIIERKEQRCNAMRVIVVGVCIVDSGAGEWFGSIAPLAKTSWRSNQSVSPPIKGREDLLNLYGHDAMLFVLEACDVLGWEVERDTGYKKLIQRFLRSIIGTPKSPLQIPEPPGSHPRNDGQTPKGDDQEGKKLEPAVKRSKAAYDWAHEEGNISNVHNMTYAKIYNAIELHPDGPSESLPPTAATFAANCRKAGVERYDKKQPCPTRSVREVGSIEYRSSQSRPQ